MNISLTGRVVRGEGYGRKIGFPTANIDRRQYARSNKKIRLGIYAGLVELATGKKFKAGIVIGPLDKTRLPKLEAYLIGFNGNLYGKTITFHLRKFLRPFRPYKSEQLLKQQIKQDIKTINTMNFHE